MLLSSFIHSNQHFKTLTQSFYIALSQNNIRRRNKITAGVLIIRAVIIIRAGGGHPKNFFEKSAENCRTVPKKTLFRILIHASPILIHWVGSRLHIFPDSSRQHPRLHILIHCRLGNQSESNTLGSRQPIRIEYYVTRDVSQSESSIT